MINVKKIGDIEQAIESNGIVFLYISSNGCNVCRGLVPKIEELLKAFPKISGIFAEIDDIPELSSKYSVFAVPGLLLFIDQKEFLRESRYVSIADLSAKISKYYSMYFGEVSDE